MYKLTRGDIASEGAYLAHGMQVIGAGRDANFRLFKNLVCGHEQEGDIRNARKFPIRCGQCQEKKLQEEAASEGLFFIEKIDKNYARYRFIGCGHERVAQCTHIREGNIRCQICQKEKFIKEAKDSGLEFLGKIGEAYGLYRFISCGHEQKITCCGVRDGHVRCNTCGDTWATRPSNLYLHKIEYGTITLLKFGRAKNVKRRSVQYGLPVGAVLKILQVWPVNTGIEADRIESLVAKQFKRYNKSKAKLVLQNSGWTECYNIEDQQAIIGFVEQELAKQNCVPSAIGLH